jgi:hypothetical protein
LRHTSSFSKSPAVLAAAVTLLTGVATSSAFAQATTPPPAPATTPPAAPAAPATPPPNYKLQWSGLVDGYIMYDANNPHSSSLNQGNIIPTDNSYAVRINTPTLTLAEINFWEAPKPNGLGFKATLQAGDTTDIDHDAFAGESSSEGRYKAVQQLYGTYALGGNGAGIDFGKFYTPYGYEVVEANADYNYTRSLPFFFLPVYHTGIRAYTANIHGFTLTGYVVNAIFNTQTAGVSDDNGSKDFIGSLNYTDPKGKYTFITTDGGGTDKFNANGDVSDNANLFLSDNDFTYNFTSTILGGLNYEYGHFDGSNDSGHSTENGYAAYFKDQYTPKSAVALRFSEEDVTFDDGENSLEPNEITATYEYKPSANFTGRLEYRHDSVNSNNGPGDLFLDSSGNETKSSQDLVILAGIYAFP